MKKAMKKFIHRFIVDEKGAVSIFLIMITLLLFIFNAVLIDFARIIIAERQTEEAANVALRSTMSSYHQKLQDAGLFAFDGDEGEATAIFKEVFEKNISPNEAGNFELLGLRSEDSEMTLDLNFDSSLDSEEVLRYQILEEMKYKAPVEIGEAILKDFLSISEKVEEASNYSKIAKEINDLAEERMEKIDEALELINAAKAQLDDVKDKAKKTSSGASYPEILNIYDIYKYHYSDYVLDLEEIEALENPGEGKEIDKERIQELKDNRKVFKHRAIAMLNEISDAATAAHENVEDAIELIDAAGDLNKDIILIVEEQSNSTGSDYDNANDLNQSQVDGSIDSSTLEDYVLEQSFFSSLLDLLNDARRSLNTTGTTDALIQKIEVDFLPSVRADFNNRSKRRIENDMTNTHDYHTNALNSIISAIDLIEETLDDYLSNNEQSADQVEDEIAEEEEKANDAQEELSKELEDIKNAYEGYGIAQQDTDKLIELGVMARGYGVASAADNKEFSFEDPEDTADEAMSFIDGVFKKIGDTLVNSRDKVYVNEYILMRFSSHDFDKSGAESLIFENNQVEYIMYGQEVFALNHYAAMSEIFAVRFAINLTQALINPTNKIFGPLFWVKAISEAFKETIDNMQKIKSGESIPIMQSLPRVRMNYKDHLRLFLFIHSEGAKFSRLMAVLHEESEQDLNEAPTYVTANATTSIQLWFLPQIADVLGRANIIDGRVEGNRFYIEKEVNFSY